VLANATCKSPATQPKNPQTILWIPTQRLIWVCRHRSSVILRTDSSSNKNPPLPWWRAPTRSPHKSENTKNQHGSFHCVLADPPSWYSPYPEQPHSVTFHSYVTILSHIWFVQPSTANSASLCRFLLPTRPRNSSSAYGAKYDLMLSQIAVNNLFSHLLRPSEQVQSKEFRLMQNVY